MTWMDRIDRIRGGTTEVRVRERRVGRRGRLAGGRAGLGFFRGVLEPVPGRMGMDLRSIGHAGRRFEL